MHSLTLVGLLVVLAALTSGCSRDGASEQVLVTGSTTLLPIAEQAAERYVAENADAAVLVSGMGSSEGIANVTEGTCDIGTSSRDLKPEEEGQGLVDTPVAYDGIAVIVSPDNPVDGLTSEQLRGIYSGEITNWREVGGDDVPIHLVNRDEASGTREAFKKIVMGKEERFSVSAVVLPGTGQVRDVVARSVGAIGYISVGFVEPRFTSTRVKALLIDGVHPDEKTVASQEYPIARTLHFFTKGEPTGRTKDFVDYVLSDKIQAKLVVEAGFVPVSAREAE